MKSEDLKNSEELQNYENTEFEKLEQPVDSITQEAVDSAKEITEEQIDSVNESEITEVSELKKPVKEKVKKTSEKPQKTKKVDLTTEISAEPTENYVVENTVTETISEPEKPMIEPVEEKTSEIVENKIAETEEKKDEPVETEVKKVEEVENIEEALPAVPTKTKVIKVTQEEIDKISASGTLPIDDDFQSVHKKERTDYSKFTQVELINALRDLLEESEETDIKADVEAIKSVFYKQRNEITEEARIAFIEAGGLEEEFVPEDDPYENDIRELLKKYGHLRKEHNKQLDSEKEENLNRKLEIIEKIKGLINNEESINKTFNEFRDLQREWREIGPVPQAKMKNLWDTYHFHVENFYDYIKINRELRDLDLRKNLELKIKLCENAEELLAEPSILKAFNTLQKYHEQWREIGPVPRDNKDDVWERFKHITSIINKKHQDFFESKKVDQKKIMTQKLHFAKK
jgi:hypothetical protein